jgi:hypothetical protein
MATALLILEIGIIVASCLLAWECVKLRRKFDREELEEAYTFNRCLQEPPKDFFTNRDDFSGVYEVFAIYSLDRERGSETFVKLAVFATDDPEYNRLLASELIEKLRNKEGAR